MEYISIDLQRIERGYYATIDGPSIRVWNVHAGVHTGNRAPRELIGRYLIREEKEGGPGRYFTFPRYLAIEGWITISEKDLMTHCLAAFKKKRVVDPKIQLKIEKQAKRQDTKFKEKFFNEVSQEQEEKDVVTDAYDYTTSSVIKMNKSEPTVLHNNFIYRVAEIVEKKDFSVFEEGRPIFKVYITSENKFTSLEDAEKEAERQAISSGNPRSIIAIVGTVVNKVERRDNLIWVD